MRVLLALLLLLSFHHSIGQNESDSTWEEPPKPWQGLMIDIGCSSLRRSGNYFQDFPKLSTWGSKTVNVSYFIGFRLSKTITIAPGLGFGMDGYMAKSADTRFNFANDSITFSSDINGIQNKKSKLAVNHLDIPLELRFKWGHKPSNTFRLAVGIKGGLVFNAHTKIKYNRDSDDETVKEKKAEDYALNKFRYGLTGRIGFGYLNAFAYYSLSNLFNNGKGPEVTPYTIGISLSPNFFFNF